MGSVSDYLVHNLKNPVVVIKADTAILANHVQSASRVLSMDDREAFSTPIGDST